MNTFFEYPIFSSLVVNSDYEGKSCGFRMRFDLVIGHEECEDHLGVRAR